MSRFMQKSAENQEACNSCIQQLIYMLYISTKFNIKNDFNSDWIIISIIDKKIVSINIIEKNSDEA